MIEAILFDLDDTLLENANERFLPAYFQALTHKLGDLVAPDEFVAHLIYATQRVIANTDPTRTNKEVFWAEFLPAMALSADDLMPILDDFYTNDFPRLRRFTQRLPEARELVQQAFDGGFDVVIATNPIYPHQAILHRLTWAGVADFPYAMITSYEHMHFAKPQPSYYREIALRIGRTPEQCLMVGDDLHNDIGPAAEAGMHTFWITDDPGEKQPADWAGTLLDARVLIEG
ncbi:MAG: HAD family hydrolase [Anaerolineae bacterium]